MNNQEEKSRKSESGENKASKESNEEVRSGDDLATEVEVEVSEMANPQVSQWGLTRKRVAIAIAGILLISVTGFGIWYLLFRGEQGAAVPAPQTVSFGKEDKSSDSLPAGEQKLTLTDAQVKSMKIEIVEVGESLEAVAASEATTGVVKANEYEETPVISLVGGVVRRINADLGQFVRRGQTIAVVSSEELATAQSRHLTLKAELNESQKRYKRALSLSDVSEESRNELDRTTANLRAMQARLAEAKSNYTRSKKLVEIGAISQREFEKVSTTLEVSEANVREAKNRLERAQRLLRINPARKNELDQFLTRVRKMQADLASSRERLLVLGLSPRRVDSLKSPGQVNADLPIVSPVTGSVTERMVNQGEIISKNGSIVEVTDLSTVWVIGQVFERDLGKLRVGSGASVTTDAFPGQLFRGNISYIDPNLDPETRTAQVRVELPSPNQKLKLGMYVNVAFSVLGGSEKTSPIVPKPAVQTIGNQKIVFEATDDPKTFILRPLRLAQEKDNKYPVIEGIFVGDKVVTEGSFLLRAEWLKTNPAQF
ncbi:MAG: efflux RND transporter periplasmic adaptor subunit [Pyrinomonadaceae bacterium]|nr:efflux RND transporter periplasmic adaptor subunit [Pyrinomonadaceae bacterium]